MAADRAAELTEAYRILSDPGRRAEYDAARGSAPAGQPASAAPPPPPPPGRDVPEAAPRAGASGPQGAASGASGAAHGGDAGHATKPPSGAQFKQERAHRDTFVRKATVDRFRNALDGVG
jgi:curved DNA-binding protein CbpA